MNALSEILKSVRLEGALYIDAEFTAPWALKGRYGMASVRQRLAGAEHVVFFHFLTEGRAKVKLADEPQAIEVSAGDLVLFARDDRHLMGSDLHIAPLEAENLNCDERWGGSDVMTIRHGGGSGGPVTRFVCGYLACSRDMFRPLLDALPRLVRIPIGDGEGSLLVRELLRVGVRETIAARPSGQTTLAKLAEILFTEALRRYVEQLAPEGKGLLAGLRDAQIGRALSLMHADPSHSWTVEELGRRVALSRSAMAQRFAALVGETPMQYLTRWRLALAARELRSGNAAIIRVAERSGYESEAAFSRAFKREFGLPPAAWRRASAVAA